jgi:hypothetical protein
VLELKRDADRTPWGTLGASVRALQTEGQANKYYDEFVDSHAFLPNLLLKIFKMKENY